MKPMLASLALVVAACATVPLDVNPAVPNPGTPGFSLHLSNWRKAVATDLMGAEEKIHVTTLGADEHSSYHIVRIRGSEALHVHETHDIAVFLLEGRGEMTIGDSTTPARAGHVLMVPRGTPHKYRNRSRGLSVGYVIFSPPFDGKDAIPVAELPRP